MASASKSQSGVIGFSRVLRWAVLIASSRICFLLDEFELANLLPYVSFYFLCGLLKVFFSVNFYRKTFSFDLNVALTVRTAFKSCWHGIVFPQIRQCLSIINFRILNAIKVWHFWFLIYNNSVVLNSF